ncbi:hypothetical protein BJ508DRAFT_418975 [Ascobolus immersus RN42]|uniref:Uncharacterized protein n=1 Tax=Ascobolus immersus RN42 TaxID=1160509 RepID=A0A3N4HM26_ASCIM|nr:hypothetical protein BJ508DRAFT_418975 [Ascobolus immersus RN42]
MLSQVLQKRKAQRERKLQKLGPLAALYGYTSKMPKTPSGPKTKKRSSELVTPDTEFVPPNKKQNTLATPDPAALLKELGFEDESTPVEVVEGGPESTIADDFAEFESEEESDKGERSNKEKEKTGDGEISEAESLDDEELKADGKVAVVDLSHVEDSDQDPEDEVRVMGSSPRVVITRQAQLAAKKGRLSYTVPDESEEEEAETDWIWLTDVLVGLAEKQARCLKAFGPKPVGAILMHAADLLGEELGEGKRQKKELEWNATVRKGEKKTEVGSSARMLSLLGEMKKVSGNWPWRRGYGPECFSWGERMLKKVVDGFKIMLEGGVARVDERGEECHECKMGNGPFQGCFWREMKESKDNKTGWSRRCANCAYNNRVCSLRWPDKEVEVKTETH